jgi:hypothetical protein
MVKKKEKEKEGMKEYVENIKREIKQVFDV